MSENTEPNRALRRSHMALVVAIYKSAYKQDHDAAFRAITNLADPEAKTSSLEGRIIYTDPESRMTGRSPVGLMVVLHRQSLETIEGLQMKVKALDCFSDAWVALLTLTDSLLWTEVKEWLIGAIT